MHHYIVCFLALQTQDMKSAATRRQTSHPLCVTLVPSDPGIFRSCRLIVAPGPAASGHWITKTSTRPLNILPDSESEFVRAKDST
jgi:hypothetical protein